MLPNEIVNKIIMMSIPHYDYIIELKSDFKHVKDWNEWDKKINPITHKEFKVVQLYNYNNISDEDEIFEEYDYLGQPLY